MSQIPRHPFPCPVTNYGLPLTRFLLLKEEIIRERRRETQRVEVLMKDEVPCRTMTFETRVHFPISSCYFGMFLLFPPSSG